MSRRSPVAAVLVGLLVMLAPTTAGGHGNEEAVAGQAPGSAASASEVEEAEMEELALQPARVLAQQALAMLAVLGDEVEAGERLEAASESEDQSDVDTAGLVRARATLSDGDVEAAIALIDESLSRPLGADRGLALHEAGREYRPAAGVQEIAGVIGGAALLAAGVAGLVLGRRSPAGAR